MSTNEPLIRICDDDLAAATGGGSAATFHSEHKADPATCFSRAEEVAADFGLKLQGTGTNRWFVDSDGERMGSASAEGGNCNLYVY